MSSRNPTYIPSPNWDIPSDSNIVVLGRIFKDPKDSESKIFKSSADPIPPPQIYEGEKTDWQIMSSIEDHKFQYLQTRYFLPDDDYLALAIEDTGVQAYFRVHNWRKPVFLITGINIVWSASISTESGTERLAQAEVKVNVASVGAPVEAGPKASWESKKKQGISYNESADYIFSYQLIRIKPKKCSTESSNKSYVKGTVFGKGVPPTRTRLY